MYQETGKTRGANCAKCVILILERCKEGKFEEVSGADFKLVRY
jgi:hypothetical protein